MKRFVWRLLAVWWAASSAASAANLSSAKFTAFDLLASPRIAHSLDWDLIHSLAPPGLVAQEPRLPLAEVVTIAPFLRSSARFRSGLGIRSLFILVIVMLLFALAALTLIPWVHVLRLRVRSLHYRYTI